MNNSVRRIDDAVDNLFHKQEFISLLFKMEAKAAYSRFKAMRDKIKPLFRGQEINVLERILTALIRMDKEGYVIDREEMRFLGHRAALDNSELQAFLDFVPQKIPFLKKDKSS